MPLLLRPAVTIPRIGDRCSALGHLHLRIASPCPSPQSVPRAKRSRGRRGARIPWNRQSSWIAAELPQVQGRVANGDDVRRSAIDDAHLAN